MRGHTCGVVVAGLFGAQALAGGLAFDAPELAARSNFSGAYNIPDSVFFSNATASLSDTAGIAVSTSVVEAVWYDDGTNLGSGGSLVFISGGFLSDVSLNENGQIVVEQSGSAQDGVILIDSMGSAPAFSVNLLSGYSTPQITDGGRIGFRGRTGGGAQFFGSDVIGAGLSPAVHVAEVEIVPASPYSFLFTPATNNADQIAGKARVGAAGVFGDSQPDEIRVWNTDGSSVLIAEDVDSDPMSVYDTFDNSVGLTDTGWVSFTSNLVGGGRGVFLSDGTTTVEIAREGVGGVGSIEFFSSEVNSAGVVAFRAFDSMGLRAVWAGDGVSLAKVATEHDLVETDLGTGRLDQNVVSSPVFGGGLSINEAGDVAFFAGLAPPENDQIEWGTGLFIARAMGGGPDLNGDGSVGAADLAILLAAWGPCGGCAADLDGNGSVGEAGDLAILRRRG